jgi:hypothetical protein
MISLFRVLYLPIVCVVVILELNLVTPKVVGREGRRKQASPSRWIPPLVGCTKIHV